MSYDLIFIPRRNDQSWDDAIEAAENAEDAGPRIGDQAWRRIIDAARRFFGGIHDNSSKDARELEDEQSGLDLNAWTREASISIPFWHSGDKARTYLTAAFKLGRVVEEATGLQGYDLQLDRPLAEVERYVDDAVALYESTSASFDEPRKG